jgi:CheY-like chemotaxis protein
MAERIVNMFSTENLVLSQMITILLVDDDQMVREMFGLALRRNGYYVIEANSGVEGLEMARKHLPNLILSDILMPEGDGATLLRDIRRDPKLKSTPVVLMTGSPDLVKARQDMKDQRADDFTAETDQPPEIAGLRASEDPVAPLN